MNRIVWVIMICMCAGSTYLSFYPPTKNNSVVWEDKTPSIRSGSSRSGGYYGGGGYFGGK